MYLGTLTILMTAVLWSTAGVLVQYVKWSAYAIASFRGICCLVILLLGRMTLEKKSFRQSLPKFTRPNIINGLCMLMTGILYLLALKNTSAANAIVLQYLAPALILVYSVLFEKSKPKKSDVMITLIVFCGCALAFSGQLDSGGMLGNILAILSAFTFAGQLITSRKGGVDSTDGVMIGSIIAGLLFLPFIFRETAETCTWDNMLAVLAIGVFQYGLANLFYAKGIRKISSLRASLIMTLEPVLNPVWVFIFIGTKPELVSVLGLVFVVTALCLQAVLKSKLKED